MPALLDSRRRDSNQTLDRIARELSTAGRLVANKACVYITGSYARGEASPHSDLDLFIVGFGDKQNRALSRLDEICVKAQLIEVTRRLDLPEFSGDGKYLIHHTVDDLVTTLGEPEDDAANTFTARLLLLLESRPLLGSDVYESAIKGVVDAYWRDWSSHESDFIPAFLVYLLWVYNDHRTVSPGDAISMVHLLPTERLVCVSDGLGTTSIRKTVGVLLSRYEAFLEETNAPEDELVELFKDTARRRALTANINVLGDTMSELISSVGNGTPLHRLMTV